MSCERFELWMMDALDGALGKSERQQLSAHINVCARCRADWEAFNALDSLLAQAPMLHPAPGFSARVEARLIRSDAQRRTLVGGLILLGAAAALCLLAVPALLNGRSPVQAYVAFLDNSYALLNQAVLVGYKLTSALWRTLNTIAETANVSLASVLTYAAGAALALATARRALATQKSDVQTVRNGH